MNSFDDLIVDEASFAYRNLVGVDRWETNWTVSSSVSTAGTLTASGRYRIQGRQCEFQAQLQGSTSIATTSGTHYLALPISPAKGLGGIAAMVNTSTNVAVGVCSINVSTSRCYLPSLGASAAPHVVAGWYEI